MSNSSFDEDNDLDFTRAIRMGVINKLTKNGTEFPEDKGEQSILSLYLEGMDKASLTRKKLKIEDKTTDLNEQSLAIIAKLLNNRVIDKLGVVENGIDRDIPVLPDNIIDVDVVPGMLDTNISSTTYSEFISNYKED